MSVRHMAAVFELPAESVTPVQRLVLLALCDNADDVGACWPTQGTLAAKTGLARKTVTRALAACEEAGLLKSELRTERGLIRGKMYHVLFSVGTESPNAGTESPNSRDTESQQVGTQSPTEPSVRTAVKERTRTPVVSAAPKTTGPTPEDLVNWYNEQLAETHGLPRVMKLTDKRRRAARARIRAGIWESRAALEKAYGESEFLRGERGEWRGGGWTFLVERADSWLKVLEGNYAGNGQDVDEWAGIGLVGSRTDAK